MSDYEFEVTSIQQWPKFVYMRYATFQPQATPRFLLVTSSILPMAVAVLIHRSPTAFL